MNEPVLVHLTTINVHLQKHQKNVIIFIEIKNKSFFTKSSKLLFIVIKFIVYVIFIQILNIIIFYP